VPEPKILKVEFKYPFPEWVPPWEFEWEIVGVEWSFWSFNLTNIQTTAAKGFFAEVIFGLPLLLLVPRGTPIPTQATPVTNVTSPLNNSNIVGVSAGAANLFECNGVDILLQAPSSPISVVLNTHNSTAFGTTAMSVSGGVAKLGDLGVAFSAANAASSPTKFSLSKNQNAQVDYAPSYSCAGTWSAKSQWAVFGSFGQYSLSNPPYSAPAFPPGSEFPK
jgi:hypothetical protein